MSAQTQKRLQKELLQILKQEHSPKGILLFPKSPENLYLWEAIIEGPNNSTYQDLKFKLHIKIPKEYPYKLPAVVFLTKIFHPNVDDVGNICLDILKENWSAVYNLVQVIISVQVLLEHPNNASPLNVEAANLWQDKKELLKRIKEWYDYQEEIADNELYSSDEDFSNDSYI